MAYTEVEDVMHHTWVEPFKLQAGDCVVYDVVGLWLLMKPDVVDFDSGTCGIGIVLNVRRVQTPSISGTTKITFYADNKVVINLRNATEVCTLLKKEN